MSDKKSCPKDCSNDCCTSKIEQIRKEVPSEEVLYDIAEFF